jgi:hypothetical protein
MFRGLDTKNQCFEIDYLQFRVSNSLISNAQNLGLGISTQHELPCKDSRSGLFLSVPLELYKDRKNEGEEETRRKEESFVEPQGEGRRVFHERGALEWAVDHCAWLYANPPKTLASP